MVHFQRDVGLCANAGHSARFGYVVRNEMQVQFVAAGLDDCFPFHEKEDDYYSEKDARLNPLRMAWVKEHINNPPDNQSTRLTEFYQAWYEWATAI